VYKTWTTYVLGLCLGIVLTLSGASAQKVQKLDTVYHVTDSVRVYFPVSRSVFDFSFEGNGERIDGIIDRLKRIRKNKIVGLDHVSIISSSSPEGPVSFNEKLSLDRVMSIANYLRENYHATWDMMDLEYRTVDWSRFHALLEQDPDVPEKDMVMDLVEKKDLPAVQALKGTETGNYLLENIYPYLRTTFAIFHYTVYLNQIDPRILDWEGMETDLEVLFPPISLPDTVAIDEVEITAAEFESLPDSLPHVEKLAYRPVQEQSIPAVQTAGSPVQEEEQTLRQKARRRFRMKWNPWEEDYDDFVQDPDRERKRWELARHESYIKTNVLAYPLLIPSLGYEWRPVNKFSFGAEGYYSAINWFSPNTKFRVLGLQAEARYWFRDNMYGPFTGIHFTFGWYNIATGGEYRYQDHQGKEPAYGTGLTLGYKVPFLPKLNRGRMGFEFTIGYGVMPLHYDLFYNVPNGRKAGEGQKIYWGIDNVAINFVYRFAGNRNLKWWREYWE
jgi:hypothetical protein